MSLSGTMLRYDFEDEITQHERIGSMIANTEA